MIIDSQNIPASRVYSRIISLVPSITELLYDLDLESEVLGITKFCIYPGKWHRNKTRVGGTKNVNIKTIQLLQPDLIIANKEENVKEQVEELAKGYDVLVTDVNNLQDALNMIKHIGTLVDRGNEASELCENIQDKFKKLTSLLHLKRKFKTAYLIWQNPYMTIGGDTFINDMMQYCWLDNIFLSEKRYPEISIDELKERSCELIILSSEPYPFKEKHLQELQLKIPDAKIILADGEMFSWYGSRLLKAAKYFEQFYAKIVSTAN